MSPSFTFTLLLVLGLVAFLFWIIRVAGASMRQAFEETPIETPRNLNWQGLPISDDEEPTNKIYAWKITPHLSDSSYDSCVIRGWQDMLNYVGAYTANYLENVDRDVLLDKGANIQVKLIRLRVSDYQEIVEDD